MDIIQGVSIMKILSGSFIFLFLFISFPEFAKAKKKKLTLKWVTIVPDSTPWAKQTKATKKLVTKKIKNSIIII